MKHAHWFCLCLLGSWGCGALGDDLCSKTTPSSTLQTGDYVFDSSKSDDTEAKNYALNIASDWSTVTESYALNGKQYVVTFKIVEKTRF